MQNVATIGQAAIQIALLLIFKKYFLYLLVQLCGTVFVNLYVAFLADKRYPEIASCRAAILDNSEKNQIKKDAEALVISRLGHVVLNGTDNIIKHY